MGLLQSVRIGFMASLVCGNTYTHDGLALWVIEAFTILGEFSNALHSTN